MAAELRKTGISVVGDMPWGTHFCLFYETKEDLFDTMARLVSFDEPARYAMARPGELQRSALDPARAANHLDWKPWTALEDGLRRTIVWFRSVPVGSRR